MNNDIAGFATGVALTFIVMIFYLKLYMQRHAYIAVASGKVVCELQETDTKTMEWDCIEKP